MQNSLVEGKEETDIKRRICHDLSRVELLFVLRTLGCDLGTNP